VPDIYQLLTRSGRLNRLVNRHRALLGLANAAPVPVRFSDGRRRPAGFRLLRLTKLWSGFPEETRASYDLYDGGDVLDVGAFHGWYSVLLAPKARPGDVLVSFEPDRAAFGEMLHNLAALADVFPEVVLMPVPAPIGDGRPAAVSFPEGSGHPRFGSADGAGARPTTTVDAFVEELGLRPAYVKVDVEGAEYFVLRGMEQTLRSFRPRIMLEVHPTWQPPGVSVADVEGVLEAHGYRRTHELPGEPAIRQWWRADAGSPAAGP
jgi:FkbM family methyltransferase